MVNHANSNRVAPSHESFKEHTDMATKATSSKRELRRGLDGTRSTVRKEPYGFQMPGA